MGSIPTKATQIRFVIVFFVDQEFKELRLIKDGSDIPFLVEGVGAVWRQKMMSFTVNFSFCFLPKLFRYGLLKS